MCGVVVASYRDILVRAKGGSGGVSVKDGKWQSLEFKQSFYTRSNNSRLTVFPGTQVLYSTVLSSAYEYPFDAWKV